MLYDTPTPITQVEAASRLGMSQPGVAKALRTLAVATPPDRRVLADRYGAGYASRVSSDTIWYRADSPAEQMDSLVEGHPDAIVSGDVAADLLSPWRFPTTLVVYTNGISDEEMARLGFVPAPRPSLATTVVRPIQDEAFVRDARRVHGVLVAHPLHVAADLIALGADRDAQIDAVLAS